MQFKPQTPAHAEGKGPGKCLGAHPAWAVPALASPGLPQVGFAAAQSQPCQLHVGALPWAPPWVCWASSEANRQAATLISSLALSCWLR